MSTRINKFVAQASGMSRRAADAAIDSGRILLNKRRAQPGDIVENEDSVNLDGQILEHPNTDFTTILLNKPVGYVCSRRGQGSKTIYELLPNEYHKLKPVGRLDKDSSGLLVMTDDGQLAYRLSHPKFNKTKRYEVSLDKVISPADKQLISLKGVRLEDGTSKLQLKTIHGNKQLEVKMSEGRNRQIRRTFNRLGYEVVKLHRTNFDDYRLDGLKIGEFRQL